MLAVNNTLPSKILPSPYYNLELIAAKIYSKYSFILCLIYNPPNSDLSYFFNLLDYLNNLLALNNKIILLGDFNLPDINWESLTGKFISSNLFMILFSNLTYRNLLTSLPIYMETSLT